MSYTPAPHGPPPGPQPARPVCVTLAALIMFAIAALALISAVTSLAALSSLVDGFRERAAATDAAPTDIDNIATAIRVLSIVIAILMLTVAVLLIVLALGNLRASNASRIFTWLVCVLGFLCGCCGIFGAFGQTRATTLGTPDTDAATAEQLGRALSDSYPGWWLAVNGALSGLQMLGYIAVAVLLALPAANEYFRRPASPQWHPPPK